jgi:hypothetical protein
VKHVGRHGVAFAPEAGLFFVLVVLTNSMSPSAERPLQIDERTDGGGDTQSTDSFVPRGSVELQTNDDTA